MELGVMLLQIDVISEQTRDFALRAERSGSDSVWVGDHASCGIMPGKGINDCRATMAVIGASTSRRTMTTVADIASTGADVVFDMIRPEALDVMGSQLPERCRCAEGAV